MKYYIKQINQKTCGITSLKVLLANKFNNENYLYLEEDDKAYSFLDLVKYASKLNIEVKGFDVEDISKLPSESFIALININNLNHYIVVEKIKKDMVYYFDPSYGKKIISLAEFKTIFLNKILLISHNQKDNLKKKKEKILPCFSPLYIFNSFIQIISIFFISFNLQKLNLALILSIFIFVLSLIFNQVCSFTYLKQYDKKVIDPLLNNLSALTLKSEINEGLKNEYLLKNSFFKINLATYNNALVLGFAGFILIVNDLKVLLGYFLLTLLILIKYCFIDNVLLKIKTRVEHFENLISEGSIGIITSNSLSYRYGYIYSFYNVISMVIMLLSSFFICYLNKSYNNLILIFILYKISFDKIEQILSLKDEKVLFNQLILKHLIFKKHVEILKSNV